MRAYIAKLVGLALVGATIVVCGGGIAGSGFPLHAGVTINGVNNDTQPVHIIVAGETYGPANRVDATGTLSRNSDVNFAWDTNLDVRGITVKAGRNGQDIVSTVVNMSGEDRQNGKRIRATFGTNQTLTAVLE